MLFVSFCASKEKRINFLAQFLILVLRLVSNLGLFVGRRLDPDVVQLRDVQILSGGCHVGLFGQFSRLLHLSEAAPPA